MRIATINYDRCHPKKCNHECQHYCPIQRDNVPVIEFNSEGWPNISETLCVGCGICIHKCPFKAINIINLAEEYQEEVVHQYGENKFRLFRLPIPQKGIVVGILGMNGMGKSTVLEILSGKLIPNFGNFDKKPSLEDAMDHYAGTMLHEHFKTLANGSLSISYKQQYVNKIIEKFNGTVEDYISSSDSSTNRVYEIFPIERIRNYKLETLSGGELQLLEIAKVLAKDSDFYIIDEPSSYLDIFQRLKVIDAIRAIAENKHVIVVEHDLAIFDALADVAHIMFGVPTSYGIVGKSQTSRHAINNFLYGFIKEENVRIRDFPIKFEPHAPNKEWKGEVYLTFDKLVKKYDNFKLTVNGGTIKKGEVVGIVGQNSTGKTTFVKILASVEQPTEGKMEMAIKVSYKPQYIKGDMDTIVNDMIQTISMNDFQRHIYESDIVPMLNLDSLLHSPVSSLSGGELQTVAIALTLLRNADVYLLDEPSAYLDANQRMEAAKLIRRVIEKRGASGFVVEHDVYFLDLVSDSVMVFAGTPGKEGIANGPYPLKKGMSIFLNSIDISFRRDEDSKRPRINKKNSVMDREQKEKGELYFVIQ
ncbi:MAG: ribosome biogenesis/translation initiation ATPase RLI [Candidatus Thermoplasmatota archaeon]|jgi:ATP-binding cassette subfamily E protein 1|nr:ribosome biogenesis/translation initiation ATPase RLI [Candidatus Thermoplasmatota archaeon]MCL5964034.1 ribosome biogenesis/translation initiation ATPase RLI [Candidatus Thermoplasmatota archaeon]